VCSEYVALISKSTQTRPNTASYSYTSNRVTMCYNWSLRLLHCHAYGSDWE